MIIIAKENAIMSIPRYMPPYTKEEPFIKIFRKNEISDIPDNIAKYYLECMPDKFRELTEEELNTIKKTKEQSIEEINNKTIAEIVKSYTIREAANIERWKVKKLLSMLNIKFRDKDDVYYLRRKLIRFIRGKYEEQTNTIESNQELREVGSEV